MSRSQNSFVIRQSAVCLIMFPKCASWSKATCFGFLKWWADATNHSFYRIGRGKSLWLLLITCKSALLTYCIPLYLWIVYEHTVDGCEIQITSCSMVYPTRKILLFLQCFIVTNSNQLVHDSVHPQDYQRCRNSSSVGSCPGIPMLSSLQVSKFLWHLA